MKENKKVVNFHKKFGAVEIGEDDNNFYFEITQDSVAEFKNKFKALYE